MRAQLASDVTDDPLHVLNRLVCPYVGCGRSFVKPVVLTDESKLPRETYYACPHCHSKLEIFIDDSKRTKVISVERASHPGEIAPPHCQHYFGFLKGIGDNAPLPDECLTCPKIMQCFVKKH